MKDNYDIAHYTYDMDRCIGCKGCVWVDHIYMPNVRFGVKCPSNAYKLFDAFAAMGREKIALALLAGEINYSPSLLDIIYMCQLCGACDAGCKRNLDLEPLAALESLRVKCVKDGQGPLPAHKKVAQNIDGKGNRYGAPPGDRLKWITGDIKIGSQADIVYFPGCAASYVEQKIAQSTAGILNKANINFMLLDEDDACCGHPLISVGLVDQARGIAQKNMDALKKRGAKTILTSCAECYKTWKVDYPKLFSKSTEEMGYRVIHLVELVNDLINDGALVIKKGMEMRATYHDPCHLGRQGEAWTDWTGNRGRYGILDPPKNIRRGTNGVYQAPRDILSKIPGLDLVEMPRTRENAFCCGAGGGVLDAYPDFAQWAAAERLSEVQSLAAGAVVSACPYCKRLFQDVSKKNKMNINVYDISEIISDCIE
ncbi:MAG: heterodisulfide reductase-related iron-sulfur binding cluster [Pseudomonadota bacterium]